MIIKDKWVTLGMFLSESDIFLAPFTPRLLFQFSNQNNKMSINFRLIGI